MHASNLVQGLLELARGAHAVKRQSGPVLVAHNGLHDSLFVRIQIDCVFFGCVNFTCASSRNINEEIANALTKCGVLSKAVAILDDGLLPSLLVRVL